MTNKDRLLTPDEIRKIELLVIARSDIPDEQVITTTYKAVSIKQDSKTRQQTLREVGERMVNRSIAGFEALNENPSPEPFYKGYWQALKDKGEELILEAEILKSGVMPKE